MARIPQKIQLLVQYRQAGPAGLTDEEAAKAAGLYRPTVCWWKRCSDLRDERWIERHADPQERVGDAGRDRIVCVISPAGEAVLAAFRL